MRFTVHVRAHLSGTYTNHVQVTKPIHRTIRSKPLNDFSFLFSSSFCTTSNFDNTDVPKLSNLEEKDSWGSDNGGHVTYDCVGDDDDDKEGVEVSEVKRSGRRDEGYIKNVKTLVNILREFSGKPLEMKTKIEQCGIMASSELVVEVLSRVRNDWEAAFTFFLWAGNQQGYLYSTRDYHAMIYILGKMRKFDTAWKLIDEMRGRKEGPCLVTKQTLLIMIRRYCAVHDVARAINTFYAYKKFKFVADIDDFHGLLSALCRYKNVQDAEQLMFCNKDVFPYDIKSFNIILNGWCNIIVSPREAERVWKEMSKRGVRHDVVSFSSIISCYSKTRNLHRVIKLFDYMKNMSIEPDRKVYNSVIHALAKGGLVTQAINLMKTMEDKNISPNIVTYNSLIKPLCKARKVKEAREAFDEMLQRGLSPTIQTYHAFLSIVPTAEEVFDLLEKMRERGCGPTNDTYITLIRKFSRWNQYDNVFKMWNEICEDGVGPDCSAYVALIHGLFLNKRLGEARKYYEEMKGKELLLDHKTDERLQDWLSGEAFADHPIEHTYDHQLQLGKHTRAVSRKFDQERDFLRQPETRRVVRERGFSFWDS